MVDNKSHNESFTRKRIVLGKSENEEEEQEFAGEREGGTERRVSRQPRSGHQIPRFEEREMCKSSIQNTKHPKYE